MTMRDLLGLVGALLALAGIVFGVEYLGWGWKDLYAVAFFIIAVLSKLWDLLTSWKFLAVVGLWAALYTYIKGVEMQVEQLRRIADSLGKDED